VASLPPRQGGDPEADFKAWIAAGKDGDLFPTWTRNVIIRNIALDTPWDVNPEDSGNAYADGVTISRSQNIWVDHVTISDGDTPAKLASDTRHDGALDIVRGSDYVTLSNSYFTKHGKTTLVGNGDSGRAWSDAGRLHVTFNGMYWNGTASRLPLIRFGQLHTFNNLVEGDTQPADPDMKFEGGLDVRYQSDVLSENNYYLFTNLKPAGVGGKVSDGKDAISYRAVGELFINDKGDDTKPWVGGAIDISSTLMTATGLPRLNNWTPPYSYTALPADQACVFVKNNAGAGRVNNPGTGATCTAGSTVPRRRPRSTRRHRRRRHRQSRPTGRNGAGLHRLFNCNTGVGAGSDERGGDGAGVELLPERRLQHDGRRQYLDLEQLQPLLQVHAADRQLHHDREDADPGRHQQRRPCRPAGDRLAVRLRRLCLDRTLRQHR
jgi:pectate lyase